MDNNSSTPISIQTEDDYSIISRCQPSGFLSTVQFGFNINHQSGNYSSPLENDSTAENEHLYTSHHALGTAYEHMKRKLSELELANKNLKQRLKVYSNSDSASSSSSTMICGSHDSEVTKAWEAYKDKCLECEKLRDDLELVEQKFTKSQNEAREQCIREDMLRVQSQQEEYKKKLQQAELDLRDQKNKEEMAREELEKEKEFHERVVQATKERHVEMENTISELQQSLQGKTRRNQEFLKDQDYQRQMMQQAMDKQEAELNEKIHDMEGKLIQEREERLRAEAELNNWKQNVEQLHLSSGLPLNMPHQQRWNNDDVQSDTNSEIDVLELVAELRSVTEELAILKRQTSQHSSLLAKVCEDPRVRDSLSSIGHNGYNGFDVPSEDGRSQITESMFDMVSSYDTRQILQPSPSSDFSQPNRNLLPGITPLAVSRQIHMIENDSACLTEAYSPHRIEILPVPDNLSTAFNNIRLAKSTNELLSPPSAEEVGEEMTSYYSTVTGDGIEESRIGNRIVRPPKRSNSDSLSSDSGTGSSTNDTLTEPNATVTFPHKRASPDGSPDGSVDDDLAVPLRYPPSTAYNIPSTTDNSGNMKAIWPNTGKRFPVDTLSPLWPPASSAGGSTQFDVVSGHSNSSNHAPSEGVRNHQHHRQIKQPLSQLSEFEMVRSVPREAADSNCVPLNHPSARPSNRAHTNEVIVAPRSTQVPSPRRRASGRRTSNSTELNEGETRTFVSETNVDDGRSCPVCHRSFDQSASQSFMSLHINGHFSGDEADEWS